MKSYLVLNYLKKVGNGYILLNGGHLLKTTEATDHMLLFVEEGEMIAVEVEVNNNIPMAVKIWDLK